MERLSAYLARIGLDAAPPASPEGLAQLQAAHRQAITFENLDVLLGRGIRIGSDAVFAKLVEQRRGGYCFEQNRLFADMLAAIGIANRPLLARARLAIPEGEIPPRTHALLLCDLEGEAWIADAGFGGSYVPPMPLRDRAEAIAGDGARHRLRRVGLPDGEWVVERTGPVASTDGRAKDNADWQAQYSFDLAPVMQADLDMGNHWASTWPQGRFVLSPIISLVLPTGFISLNAAMLTVARDGEVEKREITSAQEWRDVLAGLLKLDMPLADVEALGLFPR